MRARDAVAEAGGSGRRKVRVVWGPALTLEVTMPADGLDVGERERTGQ